VADSYRYFCRRFEQAMVEGVAYRGPEFELLLANSVVRSLAARLVLNLDGRHFLWAVAPDFDEEELPPEITGAETVMVAHPVNLVRDREMEGWQQAVIESRVSQPMKQVFREVYLAGEQEREAEECLRFASRRLVARRAFALLRGRGYTPKQGIAVKEWPAEGLRACLQWASAGEEAGRLLGTRGPAEPVTSGPVWLERGGGERVRLGEAPPVVLSETLRDADLLVSRSAAGELGFTSEETRRLRGTLVRYLTRTLGLDCVYVGEDCRHAIVDGKLAQYRVHLGSGTVLLETSRQSLDLEAIRQPPIETVIAESVDEPTARIMGVIIALCRDDEIGDPGFLSQVGVVGGEGRSGPDMV
jgi:hypothetical protein